MRKSIFSYIEKIAQNRSSVVSICKITSILANFADSAKARIVQFLRSFANIATECVDRYYVLLLYLFYYGSLFSFQTRPNPISRMLVHHELSKSVKHVFGRYMYSNYRILTRMIISERILRRKSPFRKNGK